MNNAEHPANDIEQSRGGFPVNKNLGQLATNVSDQSLSPKEDPSLAWLDDPWLADLEGMFSRPNSTNNPPL